MGVWFMGVWFLGLGIVFPGNVGWNVREPMKPMRPMRTLTWITTATSGMKQVGMDQANKSVPAQREPDGTWHASNWVSIPHPLKLLNEVCLLEKHFYGLQAQVSSQDVCHIRSVLKSSWRGLQRYTHAPLDNGRCSINDPVQLSVSIVLLTVECPTVFHSWRLICQKGLWLIHQQQHQDLESKSNIECKCPYALMLTQSWTETSHWFGLEKNCWGSQVANLCDIHEFTHKKPAGTGEWPGFFVKKTLNCLASFYPLPLWKEKPIRWRVTGLPHNEDKWISTPFMPRPAPVWWNKIKFAIQPCGIWSATSHCDPMIHLYPPHQKLRCKPCKPTTRTQHCKTQFVRHICLVHCGSFGDFFSLDSFKVFAHFYIFS